jgi:C-terminal processing protease CtpA/Prc
LINGSTFSAGEWTTEILKQLPNVTVIGDTTGGGGVASSNDTPESVGEYQLPSGKNVYIGTEYFERYDGQFIEWLGVPPDIRVIQTEADINNGRDKQLEYAINIF